MRTRPARALLLVVATLAAVLHATHAQTQAAAHPVLSRFAGTYRNRVADGGEAIIVSAIETGTAPMAAVRQRLARRHLIASDPPIHRVTIALEGRGVSIEYRHDRRNQTPALGTFAVNRAVGGGEVEVKHDLVGQRLRETYRERRGGAVHEFTLSPDGRTLHLEATITSGHLPGPITYRLEFDRS